MTEPTDAELDELRQANSGRLNFVTFSEFRTIARAALAKWGSQPVPAGYALVPVEPTPEMLSVMWVNKNSSLSEAYNRLSDAYSAMLAASPQPVACEPNFYTVYAQYEDGDEAGWAPLPCYSNETELGVKNLVLEAARREGYKGTASERLQELGWEIRPVYLAPQSSLQQPVPASAAEFALRALVAAGHVTQERVDQAMALPGAPAQAGAVPLTDEQATSLCKMGPVYAPDGQVVRTPEQYRRELEGAKLAGIRTAERAHGIKGGQHGTE